MTLPDIGILWLWVILVADLALRFMRPRVWKALRKIGVLLRSGWLERRKQRSNHKEDELFSDFISSRLSHLLRSGLHDAWFEVGELGSGDRIEFEKYIRAPGVYGIELIYRSKKHVRDIFDRVRACCEDSGLPVRVQTTGKGQISRTVRVHIGQNIDQGSRLAEGLWTDVLGLSADTPRSFDGGDISPLGELIDQPDQKILPFLRGMHHAYRDVGGPPILSGCGIVLLILSLPVVFYGLIISTLSNHGEPNQWSFTFSDITIGSSAINLVFLCLYLLLLTAGRPITRKVFRRANDDDPLWLRKVFQVWVWLVRLTLPLTVILVWSSP